MLTRAAAMAATVLVALFAGIASAAAQKQGGTLRIYHRDNPPSASLHEEATVSVTQPFMARVQQPRAVRPDQAAEQPRHHRAGARRELVVGREQDQADLQAEGRRQVARRQAVHRQGRAVHLARAARQGRAGGVQQQPAQGLVLQSAGGHDQRRPRGDLPSGPAAALVPDAAGLGLLAGLPLPRLAARHAHQARSAPAPSSSSSSTATYRSSSCAIPTTGRRASPTSTPSRCASSTAARRASWRSCRASST